MATHRDDIKRAREKSAVDTPKGGKQNAPKKLSEDIKDILEDAKDGRVKKSTQKKINNILTTD